MYDDVECVLCVPQVKSSGTRDHHGATSFDLTAAGTAQHSQLPPEGTPRAD